MQGNIAYRGNVSGIVRIIHTKEDFTKIKGGEILVTHETTPDYLTILNKVKAIVTDEGGVTSHAAVISREMRIPCVIGTKIATKLLKNGDFVNVDANKGIIKILK